MTAAQPAHDFLPASAALPADVWELAPSADPPAVSVVVPSYNHRRYALDLVRQLAAQRHPSFELVLVDDGSTDGTFEALQQALQGTRLRGRLVRLRRNAGRSHARNTGVLHARAPVIAFTDADCLPHPEWLAEGLRALAAGDLNVVQGRVAAAPDQPQPFFNHFIDIPAFDGSYSTCNVFYRRKAILAAGGFNPALNWGEDVDLGYRALRAGARGGFSGSALVYHQVVPLSPVRWLTWPLWFRFMPLRAARYPEYRRFLFLGVWTDPLHALLDLALLGLPLSLLHRAWLLLTLPYLVALIRRHGFAGRWAPVKLVFRIAWDALAFASLVAGSLRHRSLVL